MQLFNPNIDKNDLNIYNPDWKNISFNYSTSQQPQQLLLKIMVSKSPAIKAAGFDLSIKDKLEGRKSEISSFQKLVITARTDNALPVKLKIAIINKDAVSFSSYVTLNNKLQDIEISLNNLKVDSSLLLPRPYPGFQPLWFTSSSSKGFNLQDADKLQVSYAPESSIDSMPQSIEIRSVFLKK